MCPDRQILSVYFDNELASPWKEKFETHLKSCPECRARLETYKKARGFLSAGNPSAGELPAGGPSALNAAGRRVWESLARENGGRSWHDTAFRRPVPGRFWRRSVTIPFPIAAAAGVVLVVAVTLLLALRPADVPSSQFAGMGMEVLRTTPVSDINSLLEYLNNGDSADMVIIRLPETTFTSYGEPVLRAADYSKNNRKK
ncbi:MAG: zf-HC2 domain-containing protein [Treponema sp.]|nr:zf-HC2 domain-containing protein [Treponema sp.]